MFEFSEAQQQGIKGAPKNEGLKSLLASTDVTRLSKDSSQNYTTTVWGFLQGEEKGAPFSLNLNQKHIDADQNEEDNGENMKYISLNKVAVNVSGQQDKLFVVRDLSSMVNLQKMMYMKQHLNKFTEKIIKII